MNLFSRIVVFLVLIYFLFGGLQFAAAGRYQFSPLLNIPLIYVFAVAPFAAFSALVFIVDLLVRIWSGEPENPPEASPPAEE